MGGFLVILSRAFRRTSDSELLACHCSTLSYREKVLIANEDGCNERSLYRGVARVLHCSSAPRKNIAFLSLSAPLIAYRFH